MRTKFFALLLGLLIFLPTTALSDEKLELDQVLAKYYQAIGGLDKWRGLNTMVMTGTINTQGSSGSSSTETKTIIIPFKATYERPYKCRVEFTVDDQVKAQVYGGFFAWQINPHSSNPDPTPMSQGRTKYLRDTCGIENSLIDYKKKRLRVKLLGEEKIKGKNAYKISVRYPSGNIETYYIDEKTFLPVRAIGLYNVDRTEIRTTTTYTDFKDTDGYVVAHKLIIEVHGSPSEKFIKIDNFSFNPKIDSTMFDFPKDKVMQIKSKEDIEKLKKKVQ